MRAGAITVREGDMLTVDGATGEVLLGELPMVQRPLSGDFARLMAWADEARRMKVRANADTLPDAEVAAGFGAEGIGLVRTENIFLEGDGLQAMREMIMAPDERARRPRPGSLVAAASRRVHFSVRADAWPAGLHSPARSAVA